MSHGKVSSDTTFADVMDVVEVLRGPDGCPWDRQQTHESLRPHLLEECYEVLQAIDDGDIDELADELGDLVTQIAFHADIARCRLSTFRASEIFSRAICKLRRRHPHVFGEGERLSTAGEVTDRWEAIKRKERRPGTSVVEGVPTTMPALAYASVLQSRANRIGFIFRRTSPTNVLPIPSVDELGDDVAEKFAGEALFDYVCALSEIGIDAETAIRGVAARFRERVLRAEAAADKPAEELTEIERRQLWDDSDTTH